MNIIISYDSSVNGTPVSGTPTTPVAPAAFKSGIEAAVRILESQFNDALTFTLHVGFGEIQGGAMTAGALGNSRASVNGYTYDQLRARIVGANGDFGDQTTGDDAVAAGTLPATDPISGTHKYMLTKVEAVALGLLSASTAIDVYIGLSNTAAFDYNRNDGISAGSFDFLGTVLHEITETMGRTLSAGGVVGGTVTYSPLDLLHYSATNTRDLSATQTGYFSINGGLTNLADFNTKAGGDAADWADPVNDPGASVYLGNDSFLAFSGSGVVNELSEVDLIALDVLGYNRVTDDIRGNQSTARTIAQNGSGTGTIEAFADRDWFRVVMTAGLRYRIDLGGVSTSGGTLADPYLRLYDSASVPNLLASDDDGGPGSDAKIVYTSSTTKVYYIAAGGYNDSFTGSYTLRLTQDDYDNDNTTNGQIAVNSARTGNLETMGDRDWFAVQLTAGVHYDVALRGAFLDNTTYGTLFDPDLRIYGSTGTQLAENDNSSGNPASSNKNSLIVFTPGTSGTYYIAAGASGDAYKGTYTVVLSAEDDYTADGLTHGQVTVGGSSTGNLEIVGDHDMFKVALTGGQHYLIKLTGVDGGGGTLANPYLRVYSGSTSPVNGSFSKELLAQNDDSGPGRDAWVVFTPKTSGTYYLDAAAFNDAAGGTYHVSVSLDAAPVITSNGGGNAASTSIAENKTAVTNVHATDADAGTTLFYSIVGGADAAKFQIDSTSGALSFKAAPDFEAPADSNHNNGYTVEVRAYDGGAYDDQIITVNVTNVNEAPSITSNDGGASASIALPENMTAVTTVHATDPDARTKLTYSILAGLDSTSFRIDTATGALSFKSAPNFEAPADGNHNNSYTVNVRVSDGSLTDTQTITAVVSNVNETPVNTLPGPRAADARGHAAIVGLSIADVDAGNAAMKTVLSAAHGTLTVASVAHGATVSHSGTGTVTLAGTLAQINATLAASHSVNYTATAGFAGADTLTITTSDNGHTGSGGVKADIDHLGITVPASATGAHSIAALFAAPVPASSEGFADGAGPVQAFLPGVHDHLLWF